MLGARQGITCRDIYGVIEQTYSRLAASGDSNLKYCASSELLFKPLGVHWARTSRHNSWRFKLLLPITPDFAQCINDIHRSEDALKRILSSQILNGSRPDHLVNVEVRFARSDLNHGCSELLLEGYVVKSWRIILCIDGSESAQRGVQSGAIALARTRPVLSSTPSRLYPSLAVRRSGPQRGRTAKKLKGVPHPSWQK